jgi:hypothetical protein
MIRLFRQSAPPASTDVIEVAHEGRVFAVAMTRSPTARRITLRVRAATRDVVVTLPRRASVASARAFVESHAGWIAQRMARLPRPAPFVPGGVAPLRGRDHVIVHRPGARGVVWIEDCGATPSLCVAGDAAHLPRRVADFLKREARRDLEAAVARHAAAVERRYRGVTLRDTTSRWGSCTAQGALSFSWRLILAPPFVLDYLAAHEVAHLVHHDHSPRFWALTRRLAPETDRAEEWLRLNGASLHRYGAQHDGEQDDGERDDGVQDESGRDGAQEGARSDPPRRGGREGDGSSPAPGCEGAAVDPVEALLARARALIGAIDPDGLDATRRVA